MPAPSAAAAALHEGRRSDRDGEGAGRDGERGRRRRDAPPRGAAGERSPPRRRENEGRGRERERSSRRSRSPPPDGRSTPNGRPTKSVALVAKVNVVPGPADHAEATQSISEEGSRSPSRSAPPMESPEKEVKPKKRRKPHRSSKSVQEGGAPGPAGSPLVTPTGHFDYTPVQQEDACVNWSSWLLKYGMQDGLLPVSAVIKLIVDAGFWSPAVVAGRPLADFTASLRRLESAIAAHGSFDFLVERVWRLSVSNGPKIDSIGPSAVVADPVHSLLKAIQGRGKANERNGVFRQAPADDEEVGFDLGSALRSLKVTQLPVHWFSELKRLGYMSKQLAKAVTVKGPLDKQTVFLADTAFEDWIPPWVGVTLQPPQKTALLKLWRQKMGQDGGMALSCILNFWLSHAVVGVLSFHSVMAHMLLLVQMMVERGTSYTVSYSRALQLLILNEVSAGTAGPLEDYLVQLNRSVASGVDMRIQEMLTEQLRSRDNGPKPEGKSRGRGAAAAPPSDTLSPGVSPGPKGQGKAGGKRKKVYICFLHDPAQNKVCPQGQACKDEHVNTKEKEGRERYDAAYANYKGPRSQAGKKKKDGE